MSQKTTKPESVGIPVKTEAEKTKVELNGPNLTQDLKNDILSRVDRMSKTFDVKSPVTRAQINSLARLLKNNGYKLSSVTKTGREIRVNYRRLT